MEEDNKLLLELQDVKRRIGNNDIEKNVAKYKKNSRIINSMKKLSHCNNIDEILEKVKKYEDIKERRKSILSELSKVNETITIMGEDISLIEEELKKKLKVMGIEVNNLLDIELYIKEYKEKFKNVRK